ncbi:beta-eliminating lyase-related protein [Streptacidiphilus sp. ASG 303]|nr:beta-eliminating lyase-related protein [Streptacidiphilus sp. ASG 303]MCD0482483.1 beta-eliminating lyase-related protein [Streptacidiphilus sp. ASG 303]
MRERRTAALRGCDRVLSQGRPRTVRERLAELAALADRPDTGGGDWGLDGPPDVYGDGPVDRLERRTAELLGFEDAVFFPTGTMAQQAVLRCWAERTGSRTVAMHPLAHPEVHERDAYAVLSGLRSVHPTTAPRLPTAAEVQGLDEPFGTLMLELPLRDAGFVLPTWDELCAAVDAGRGREAVVHVDGARLWETTAHFGRTLPEIAGLADSVYVSFYKSLGGLSGAAVACPAEVGAQCRAWRHRYGGQLFQQWPTVLSALLGLERELPRLPEYAAHARVVAAALGGAFAGMPGAVVHPDPPHTHQFRLWLPYPAGMLEEAGLLLAEETGRALFGGWREGPVPGLSVTEVTVAASALEWSAEEVAESAAGLLERLARA